MCNFFSSSSVELTGNSDLFSDKPKITVFDAEVLSVKRKNKTAPLTPYQRYKMVKPFAENLLQKEEKKAEELVEVKKEVSSFFLPSNQIFSILNTSKM